jgi:hypothetical protein
MLLQTLGANAEFVRRIGVSRNIKRIALPNLKRQSGLIVNHSSSDCYLDFAIFPHKLISFPTFCLLLPKSGGNIDIPAFYTGTIWAKWVIPTAIGSLQVHHYFYRK